MKQPFAVLSNVPMHFDMKKAVRACAALAVGSSLFALAGCVTVVPSYGMRHELGLSNDRTPNRVDVWHDGYYDRHGNFRPGYYKEYCRVKDDFVEGYIPCDMKVKKNWNYNVGTGSEAYWYEFKDTRGHRRRIQVLTGPQW